MCNCATPTQNNTNHVLPPAKEALTNLNKFREDIQQCLPRRTRALTGIIDGILQFAGPVDCVAHLSLNQNEHHFTSLYKALSKGQFDKDKLTKLFLKATDRPGFEPVYNLDTTPYIRPDSTVVDGLHMAHITKRNLKTGAPNDSGWEYQTITRQSHKGSSWQGVVCVDRVQVGTGVDRHKLTSQQIQQVATWHWEQESTKPLDKQQSSLFVMDSAHPGTRLTHDLRKAGIHANVLCRVSSRRVYYGTAKEVPPEDRKAGGTVKHGDKLAVADPHSNFDFQHTFLHDAYGEVTLFVYKDQHQKLVAKVAGFESYNRSTMPIVPGHLIRVQCKGGKRGMGLWLWYDGQLPEDDHEKLQYLFTCYSHRFDIEHFFKFCKQTLGLTSPKLSTAAATDNWVMCVFIAYNQLLLSRGFVEAVKHPWEKVMSKVRATPGRVKRALLQCWGLLVKNTRSIEVFYKGGKGREVGSENKKKNKLPTFVAATRVKKSKKNE